MESNSSKNSHGRDYWGNQQVSEAEAKLVKFIELNLCFPHRHRARHRVEKIKLHHQVTRDEARRLQKARIARKEFHRTLATSSEQMEAQLRQRCRQTRCWRVVARLMSRLFHVPTN